jgi:hypothetical protein
MVWTGYVASFWEKRNTYRILIGKLEGNRSLGRPRPRWEKNIKMELRDIELDAMDWINLAQDRGQWRVLANMVINHRDA